MITFETIESILDKWRTEFRNGYFIYADPLASFRATAAAHFGNGPLHGVYVIRQRDTREILYIGKGGTIDREGQFKRQDLLGRLQNVRNKDVSADEWFRNLVHKKGPLLVEYLILELPVAPAYVEATLLQSYFAEHRCLPPKNNSL
jgi:hypothetical protein